MLRSLLRELARLISPASRQFRPWFCSKVADLLEIFLHPVCLFYQAPRCDRGTGQTVRSPLYVLLQPLVNWQFRGGRKAPRRVPGPLDSHDVRMANKKSPVPGRNISVKARGKSVAVHIQGPCVRRKGLRGMAK